jgi:SSS family solute:Na+ symporter
MVYIPLHGGTTICSNVNPIGTVPCTRNCPGKGYIETIKRKTGGSSVRVARLGILIAVLIAVVLGFILPSSIVAVGTSIWFGITAAAFLAIYVAALYWRRATKEGAIAGLVSGALVSLNMVIVRLQKISRTIRISQP